jgi:hypothetical protein
MLSGQGVTGPAPAAGPSHTGWPGPAREPCCRARGGWLPRERDNWGLHGGVGPREVPGVGVRARPARPGVPPEVNYYVGGNTKFYGAALCRLRPEDFGNMRHTARCRRQVLAHWPSSPRAAIHLAVLAEMMCRRYGQRFDTWLGRRRGRHADPTGAPRGRATPRPPRRARRPDPAAQLRTHRRAPRARSNNQAAGVRPSWLRPAPHPRPPRRLTTPQADAPDPVFGAPSDLRGAV